MYISFYIEREHNKNMYTGLNYESNSYISPYKNDILKTKGKLKIMRDDMVEYNIMHIMTTISIDSGQ